MSIDIRRKLFSAFVLVILAFLTITMNTLAQSVETGAGAAPDATVPGMRAAATAANAVSHWPFDDGSGTTATNTIMPALNGALNGGATWSTDVAPLLIANPYAIALDGSTGFVEIPDDVAIDFDTNQDFTVAFWTKPAATQTPTGGNADNAVLEKWSDGPDPYPYVVRYLNQLSGANEGKIFVARYDGTLGTGITSSVAINDGSYHHVAMVRSGGSSGTLSLYIDGVLQDSIPDVVSSTTTNTSPLFVGKRGNNINYYSGLVDDLRIYNGALTSNEVALLGTGCPDITTMVSTWAELNNKIACFNRLTSAGTYTLTLTADINLAASTRAIDNSTAGVELTIEGNGHTVDGQDNAGFRPFEVAADTAVTLNRITITGGNVTGDGGGILNAGFLTVRESTIAGNQASTGGGIHNSGSLALIDSTISANRAANGGGIWNFDPSSEMTLTNSTVSGNSVTNAGGGIGNAGLMTLTNSTVADNSSILGAGIFNRVQLILNNSILANNTGQAGAGSDCEPDRGLGTVTAAFSLIEANLCDLGAGIGNITGQDPNLGSLQNNGGPTLTHALLLPSPAIEAGSNALAVEGSGAALPFDQRGVGYRRFVGTSVDMGAFERPCVFPDSVGDEAALNDAITCFNAITVPGSYTITLTADIGLTGNTTTIDNATAGVTLLIDGNGKTLDGSDAYRPLDVAANTTVTIQNLTITNGKANPDSTFGNGGAIRNAGAVAIMNSTLTGNTATRFGGGVFNTGTLAITNSTLSNNNGVVAQSAGGGLYNEGGAVTIMNSTLSGNRATQYGGGVFNTGALTAVNSTLSGNDAAEGGGVYNQGDLTITNSTLSGGLGFFGGVRNAGGAVTINNSIITASSGPDCSDTGGGSFSGSANLIGDTSGPCAGAAFRLGAVTNFDTTLADNGGPTWTHALLAGSNAINAGNDALALDESNAPLTTDQRGFSRFIGPVDVGAVESDLGCPTFPASVDTERALNVAIDCYNDIVAPGSYTITFTANIDLSGSTTGIDNGTSGVALLIEGNGFTLDGKNLTGVRPVDIAANTTVAIQNLTVTGGNISGSGSSGSGGGIRNAGDLTITNSTVSGNSGFYGGGVSVNGGNLTIMNSTVSGNTARFGGGFYVGGGGNLTITNSTLSGNMGRYGGGVTFGGGGDLTITNSTVSGNGASVEGGGLHLGYDTVTINNSIITNSTSGGDCIDAGVTVLSGSSNLIDDTTGPCSGAAFRIGAVTNFDTTLADNGGPTLTHALLPGSNAINAGDDALAVDENGVALSTDQRGSGFPRFSGQVDVGAVEVLCPTPLAISDTTELANCITWANANPGADTLGLDADITLNAALPQITSEITLEGANFYVDGASAYRIFEVTNTGNLTVNQITVQNGGGGGSGSGNGGGIYNDSGTLTVTNSTFATNNAIAGGGIYNDSGTTTVTNSTFSGNSGSNFGGGIYNDSGTLTVTNSTFSGNSSFDGGGIFNFSGTLTLTHSTFSGNSTPKSGIYNSGIAYLAGVILDTGPIGSNCQNRGTLNDNGYNLSDDASCGFSGTPANNATLNLSALSVTPTPGQQVHTPQAGSDAIDVIPNGTTVNNNGVTLACNGTTTDQLGNARPINVGDDCTAGAVEVGCAAPVTPDVSITISGTQVQLSWTGTAAAFDVFRSTQPYFTPTAPPYAGGVSSAWLDPDTTSIGDVGNNYFYVLQAASACGQTTDSKHIGEFDFAIAPGTP